MSAFRPILLKYIANYETFSVEDNLAHRPQTPISPLRILADESGVKLDTLYTYHSGKNSGRELKWISFDTADTLLCAMGLEHLWFVEPLSEYYEKVELP